MLGFEIIRPLTYKSEIKIEPMLWKVEQKIFGFYDIDNLQNHWVILEAILDATFTNVTFVGPPPSGPVQIQFSSARFTDCKVRWNASSSNPFFKEIPFAWVIHYSIIRFANPILHAENDFYYALLRAFGKQVMRDEGRDILSGVTKDSLAKFYQKLLKQIESEYSQKIQLTTTDEEVFQTMLNKYSFILEPSARSIEIKLGLTGGTQKTDYVITMQDESIVFVELERPHDKLFVDGQPSARLKHARDSQVAQWKRLIPKMERFKGKQVRFLIVIGLASRLSAEEKRLLEEANRLSSDTKIVTYDMLLDNIGKMQLKLNQLF
ncbi:MAG: Shedu anti-phage system protein SduA domain-containing protein [Nitrososphaera sp.]